MKLTSIQIAALKAMPFECTTWGGKPMSRPTGAGTQRTWWALRDKGLARVTRDRFTDKWVTTKAGRDALAALST